MKESKNMKLGIDISQIVYKGTGVARFTQGLTDAILNFDKKNKWIFFFSSLRRNIDPELGKKISEKGHSLIKWKIPPTLLSFFWNDLHFISKHLTSNILHLTSFDWFITSDWTEPPLPVNKATIVHDLVYLRYPETVDSKILTTQKKRLSLVKHESKIIFADSNATKQDLIDLLQIDSKKIHVNYPGVEVKKPSKEQVNLALKKYNLKKPFILTVGKIEPRKNIPRLVEAFKKNNNKSIDLVIVGPKGWDISLYPPAGRVGRYNDILNNIHFLGLIPDIDLFALYSACLIFVFPSIWEGFGYPVVEAMRLGAPIATSNTSSLKEVVDDSALLFNPLSVNEMYQCIDTLIHDDSLRIELSKKAVERSKMFTWLNYYDKFISVLKNPLTR
ncbi:hypothetical protein A3A46_00290 [Candidatus Roizmanbacteria bacterium RIFCSPLOWO2_01_FULL_37_13]|nr:MAG: hypothetical protein A3A46_00290 [Candidatus Roizmanbacteria bacterium RIFCSPLOWO2_01_FULL_37_13]